MYETIKKFLEDGGKCLLIENGKPVGVVLTMAEFDNLKNGGTKKEAAQSALIADLAEDLKEMDPVRNSPPQWPSGRASAGEISNGVAASAVKYDVPDHFTFDDIKDMDFSEPAGENARFAVSNDISLEDLDIDELPY
jgi:hypothetical protein